MFTSDYIKAQINKNNLVIRNGQSTRLNDYYNLMNKNIIPNSKIFFNKINDCDNNLANINWLGLIFDLDQNKINYLGQHKKWLSCLINQFLYWPNNINYILDKPSLHTYTNNAIIIGAGSAFGTIFKLKYYSNTMLDLPFLFKTIQNLEDKSLYSEAVIGFYVINKIRATIPNFVYTHAIFSSAPSLTTANKSVVSWCDGSSNIPYTIIEDLRPGDNLSNKLDQNITAEHFLNWYLQVLLALNYAEQKYGFTHYDLHHNNVFITNKPPRSQYLINTPLGDKYIQCNFGIAKIIDFGLSRANIDHQGRKYYVGGLNYRYNILPNKSFAIGDAYKLLLHMSSKIYKSRGTYMSTVNSRRLYQVIEILVRYFNNRERVDKILFNQADDLYYLVINVEKDYAKINLNSYLEYIFKQSEFKDILDRMFLSNNSTLPLYNLNDVKIPAPNPDWNYLINNTYINNINLENINQFLVFNDYANRSNNQLAKNKSSKYIQDFNHNMYQTAINSTFITLNDILNKNSNPYRLAIDIYRPLILQIRQYPNTLPQIYTKLEKDIVDMGSFINIFQYYKQSLLDYKTFTIVFKRIDLNNIWWNDNVNNINNINTWLKDSYVQIREILQIIKGNNIPNFMHITDILMILLRLIRITLQTNIA